VTLPDVYIRPAGRTDLAVIQDALVCAINWSPARPALARGEVLGRTDIAHYVAGWPRPGDVGVVVEVRSEPAGAAWLRQLPPDDPGHGFVAEGVPELSIGVYAGHRSRGLGRRLLRALLSEASAAGVERVSLSVERANRARHLYLSEGFCVVGGDESSDTMLLALAGSGARAAC
jgi:GNAT superfamily N-acetyltransferase